MRAVVSRTARLAAAVVLVGGCGSPSGEGEESASGIDSPLAELFGWADQSSPAEQRAQQLAVEESVAECMRAEGFEYTPVDYEAQFGGFAEEDAELFSDPDAYGEKYGYGVVHNYEQWEEPYLLGEDGEGGFGGPIFEDPNQDYVMSLSQSEQEEYYKVLYGDQSFFEGPAATSSLDGEFEDGEVNVTDSFQPPPLDQQGCQGKAQLEVYGEDQFAFDPEVQQRLEDFFTRSQDDPEIEAANQDWIECMRNSQPDALESTVEGFKVTGPDSMYQLVDFLKLEATGQAVIDYQSDDGGFGGGYSTEGGGKPIPDDELEALRRRELEIWKADRQCQKDVDMDGIRKRIEQQLVDELKAEFPDLGKSGD